MSLLPLLLAASVQAAPLISEKLGGTQFAAGIVDQEVLVRTKAGKKWVKVFTHSTVSGKPRLDAAQPADKFYDFGGIRALLYHMPQVGSDRDSLHVLLFLDGRFRKAGVYLDGAVRDLDGDGVAEIIATVPPKGGTLIQCGDFHTDLGAVRHTEVYVQKGKGFVPASAKFQKFFARRAQESRDALSRLEPQKLAVPGLYAAAALTLYHDERIALDPQTAWMNLDALITENSKLTVARLPGNRHCVGELRAEARQRLGIPADW